MIIQTRIRPVQSTTLLTGFLDILFLLVFFFIIGGNWINSDGLRIADDALGFHPGGFADPVVLVISANNRIALQGQQLDAANWNEQLKSFFGDTRKNVLVISDPTANTEITFAVLSVLTALNQQVVFSSPTTERGIPSRPAARQ